MTALNKSTIVRFRNEAMKAFFRYGENVVPARTGRVARNLWFSAPPRMAELPVPDGGEAFEVLAQGHTVRGMVWGVSTGSVSTGSTTDAVPTIYLVHGWGGRGSQFGALVEPLVEAGHRVVMFDAPAHGDSDHGPAGPRSTNGVEFAKALDAVFCEFGPAEAVIAHSMGTISTYLAIRHGWFGAGRFVFVAPMVEFDGLLDQFQQVLGFGPRTRRVLEREVEEFVGVAVRDFDARVQAAYVEPRPTLIITDRDDRQTPYADVVDFARTINAPLITTEGLGHRKVLRDPEVVQTIVEYVGGAGERAESA
jgi:pimeloyl-ACP methyl ester carboxylesterase